MYICVKFNSLIDMRCHAYTHDPVSVSDSVSSQNSVEYAVIMIT